MQRTKFFLIENLQSMNIVVSPPMPYSTLFQIVYEVKNFSARNQSLVSLFDYINQVIVNHLLLL